MMKKYDVLLMGEALVDFVPQEDQIPGRFQATVGGAPNNVACGLGKLGLKVALLARVGRDALGKSIIKTVQTCGADTKYIQIDEERFTTVTIVMPQSEDMLRYAIYRNNSADGALEFDEIPEELFENIRVLHYGTLSAETEKSRETMRRVINKAKENQVITSIDVNLRPNSWHSRENMIEESLRLIEDSDIVKMTKDEAELLGIEPVEMVKEKRKVMLITDGEKEASIWAPGVCVKQKPKKIEAVDVTGGGDSFMAAFLYYYITYKEKMPKEKFYREAIDFAITASSISVQKYGAIESFPTLKEIELARGN